MTPEDHLPAAPTREEALLVVVLPEVVLPEVAALPEVAVLLPEDRQEAEDNGPKHKNT